MTIHFPNWTAFAVASAIVMAQAVPAWADSAKFLGKSGEWNSYVYTNKTGKVCYAALQPKRSLNAPAHRADAYFSVTDRTAGNSVGVVSVTEGFATRKDVAPEIDVDGAKFSFYAADGSAWARDDTAVVKAMLKGKTMLVYGMPEKGPQSVDTYSLDGFGKALAEIGRACGLK